MDKIPKICHLYFGGSGPMAQLMVFTILSFHKYNPDWKINVYRTKQVNEELGKNKFVSIYDGKDYFYMIEELPYVNIIKIDISDYRIKRDAHSIQGSDIFRMNILYREGGLYSDFDVIWLKPMSEFVNIDCIGNPRDFDTTVCYYNLTDGHHSVSNIISRPRSLFLLSVMESQGRVRKPYGHMGFSTKLLNRKYPVLATITKTYPKILALRYETFYPYSIFELEQLYYKDNLELINNKNVMCVHWFNGHEYSQDYINNGGYGKECSMTSILKQEGYI
jgi:hypothetical protein